MLWEKMAQNCAFGPINSPSTPSLKVVQAGDRAEPWGSLILWIRGNVLTPDSQPFLGLGLDVAEESAF